MKVCKSLVLIMIVFTCVGIYTVSAYSADSSLVIHYTFDTNPGSTAVDLSQYANNGAVTDCSWLSTFGGRSGIMRFNDTTSSINCGNDNSLYFDGDMTVEMWVRWNRQILNQSANIFGETKSTFRFGQNYVNSLMLWYNCEYDHTQSMRIAVDNNLIENYRNDTGGWSHVAMVVEYPRCRFYKNGELFYDAYMPAIGILKNEQRVKYIGKGEYGGDSAPIDLDEFRWYKRALPAAEIAAHAAGQNPNPMQEDEVFIEPDWYKNIITTRLSSKGYGYSGYTAVMSLKNGSQMVAGPTTINITEAFPGCGRYVASNAFSLPGLENTTLTAQIDIYNVQQQFVKSVQKANVSVAKPDWVDVDEGYAAAVPGPWTNVVAQQNPDGTIAVNTLGRLYEFGPTPFFSDIQTQNNSILASPVQLRVKTDSSELTWNTPATTLIQSSDTKATVTQSYTNTTNKFQIDISSVTEYDGYSLFDLNITTLEPITGLSYIYLDIPLLSEYATLCVAERVYPYNPAIPMACDYNGGITGDMNFRFSPDIWIGNEEVGLVWQTETDEEWDYSDIDSAMQIIHDGGTTILRANLVNVPQSVSAGDTFHYQFALMATPVKPLIRNGFDLRIARSDPYGEDLSLPYRVEADGQPTLDHYVDKGIRDLFINTATIYPWPMPTTQVFSDAFDVLVDAAHARGIRLHQYMIHQRFPITVPEWDIYGRQMSMTPFNTYTPGGVPEDANGVPLLPYYYHGPVATHYGANSQGTVFFCPKSKAVQDAYLHSLGERLDRYSDDGIYLDGTNTIVACNNSQHGCGYVKNSIQYTTYPAFACREFAKRIYNTVKSRDPNNVIDLHMSYSQNHAALAFCDVQWIGEQWYHLKETGAPNDYMSGELPLDMFRAEFMGHQLGIATEVLDYRLGNSMKLLAISVLHDVSVRVRTPDDTFSSTISAIWKARDEFGVNDANVEKLYYWNNSSYVTVSPDKCYATLIKHPQNGVLAIISNLDPNTQNLTVNFDLAALGLDDQALDIKDVVTGGKYFLNENDELITSLESEQFLYLWIQPGAGAGMKVIFSDDFEDDIAYDDGPYTEAGAWQNGPPANVGKPGRWLSGLWTIDSRFPDQNWNINVVKDSTYTYYWGDPVAKPGKELNYLFRNLQDFSNVDPELYEGFNRDGFGKFTDADGDPVRVMQGQTLRGSFKICRLANLPAFALTTNIDAMVASTASEPMVTDIKGVNPYPYSTLQHYMSSTEPWNPNVASILSMSMGKNGIWFNTVIPKTATNLSGGVTSVALDSQRVGIDAYLAFPDNSDRQNDKPYQTVYFEYTVGNPTFDVLRVDGRDIHEWIRAGDMGWYEETSNSVPFGNYLGAAQNGIDGFVLGHIRHESNGYHAFYDDFEFGILPVACGDEGTRYNFWDLNEDCYVEMKDYAMFSSDWSHDFADLADFAYHWLSCTDPANPVRCGAY